MPSHDNNFLIIPRFPLSIAAWKGALLNIELKTILKSISLNHIKLFFFFFKLYKNKISLNGIKKHVVLECHSII